MVIWSFNLFEFGEDEVQSVTCPILIVPHSIREGFFDLTSLWKSHSSYRHLLSSNPFFILLCSNYHHFHMINLLFITISPIRI